MRRLKIIINNIKYNAVSQIAAFLINLAVLPFIVFRSGAEVYGAYILVMTFTGYVGLMDMGVGGAAIKYIAEFSSKDDTKKVRDIISASFTFFVIVGIISAAMLFSLSFCFEFFFKVGSYNKLIIKQLFWVAAGASLFIWPGRIFEHCLQGYQRYDRFALNNIIFTLLSGAAAYFVFSLNLGIVFYLVTTSVLTVLKYTSAYCIVRSSLLKEGIEFPCFKKDVYILIFDFSFYTFLSSLAGVIIFNLDSIIVGTFVSVAAVTVYNVGFSIQQGLRMLNSLIGGPLFPAYAEMEGRREYEKQKQLFFKGTKYVAFIFVPIVLITIIFAKPFIVAWMGESFIMSVLPAQILLSFWLFNGILEIGSGILSAKGMVKIIFKLLFLNAVVNLLLSLILVRSLGIIGVALGTSIPMICIYFPLIMRHVFKVFKVTFKEYFDQVIKKNVPVCLFAVGISFLIYALYPPRALWLVVLEMFAAYILTILAGYRFFFLEPERKELQSIMGFKTQLL
ncbi:MAG: flippase [Candidatus Omnitrophota bacterium]